jgi:hypothetical protein
VFNNGLYYSGDTAQAIRKGVSFKFSDINQMFEVVHKIERIPFTIPVQHNLTVNFRSHNQILHLANNIVGVLERIFPNTIDIMEKESAKANGPRPILLHRESSRGENEEIIRRLLIGDQGKFFSCNQAIIVRSEQSKEQLDAQLLRMKGLVLTA